MGPKSVSLLIFMSPANSHWIKKKIISGEFWKVRQGCLLVLYFTKKWWKHCSQFFCLYHTSISRFDMLWEEILEKFNLFLRAFLVQISIKWKSPWDEVVKNQYGTTELNCDVHLHWIGQNFALIHQLYWSWIPDSWVKTRSWNSNGCLLFSLWNLVLLYANQHLTLQAISIRLHSYYIDECYSIQVHWFLVLWTISNVV